jgi:hypothetical protein
MLLKKKIYHQWLFLISSIAAFFKEILKTTKTATLSKQIYIINRRRCPPLLLISTIAVATFLISSIAAFEKKDKSSIAAGYRITSVRYSIGGLQVK